ncbi:unnamed protein product [Orchesella dallaii]|uniref:Uncharacterized protein n=1 Tax=Orchesella dallaii TaxID=48710 RepID=A0ABP1PSW0_9HEXA
MAGSNSSSFKSTSDVDMDDVICLSSDDEEIIIVPSQVSHHRRIPPPAPSLPPLNPEDFYKAQDQPNVNSREKLSPVTPEANTSVSSVKNPFVTPEASPSPSSSANISATPAAKPSSSPMPLLPSPRRIDLPQDPPVDPPIVHDSSDDEASESENAFTSQESEEASSELSEFAYNLGQQNNTLVHLINQIVPKLRAEKQKVAFFETQNRELKEAHKLQMDTVKAELEETKAKLNNTEEELTAARKYVNITRDSSHQLEKKLKAEVNKVKAENDVLKSELEKRNEIELVSKEREVLHKKQVEMFRQELGELKKAVNDRDQHNPEDIKDIEIGVEMLTNALELLEPDDVIEPMPSTSGMILLEPTRAGNTIEVLKKATLKKQKNHCAKKSCGDKSQSKKIGNGGSQADESTKETASKLKRKRKNSMVANPNFQRNEGEQEKE